MDKPADESPSRVMLLIVVISTIVGLGAGYRSESIAGFLMAAILACLILSTIYAGVARLMGWRRIALSDLAVLLFFLPP